jgi:hypothetical protein
MVAERLAELDAAWASATVDGDLLRGPGTLGVVLRPNHTGAEAHVDLDFVLDLDRPAETTIPDCCSGPGETPEEALRRAVQTWAELTAATVFELVRPANRLAEHLHADEPGGFPGWHLITAGWMGFGFGDPAPLAQWATDEHAVTSLAPVIERGLSRPELNGVKLLFGGTAGDEIAEVRINGVVDRRASRALAGLPWPRLAEPVFARAFLLLAHREGTPPGQPRRRWLRSRRG